MLGTPADTPENAPDPLGQPVLLKRLGNLFEGELARNRLADAGIPSLLAGVDAFHGDSGGSRGQVELFVPQSLVDAALDVLDAPPLDEPDDGESFVDDPGRPFAFRAFVAAVIGWLVVFLGPFGVWLAMPTFVYAVVLATRAVRRSPTADRTLRLQVATAVLIAVVGAGVSIAFTVEMVGMM